MGDPGTIKSERPRRPATYESARCSTSWASTGSPRISPSRSINLLLGCCDKALADGRGLCRRPVKQKITRPSNRYSRSCLAFAPFGGTLGRKFYFPSAGTRGILLHMAETTRERSTIKFPYGDLEDALEVAQAIHTNYGRSATLDQLAAAMGQTLSGAFRNKVATASTFGVVETARKEVSLTDLGEQLVDPQTEASARAQAFLAVPLYQGIYENFRGRRLPGDTGLEAEIVRLGVSSKVAGKARQALNRSAEQAGFFSQGKDRLVEPGNLSRVLSVDPAVPVLKDEVQPRTDRTPSKHPLIMGLWEMLPDPSKGQFTPEQQADWLEAAKVNLRLLYGGNRPVRSQPTTAPDDE